jgi:hypothetical protein
VPITATLHDDGIEEYVLDAPDRTLHGAPVWRAPDRARDDAALVCRGLGLERVYRDYAYAADFYARRWVARLYLRPLLALKNAWFSAVGRLMRYGVLYAPDEIAIVDRRFWVRLARSLSLNPQTWAVRRRGWR